MTAAVLTLGIVRAATGLVLTLAPGVAQRFSKVREVHPFTRLALRGLGARDVVIGVGLFTTARSGLRTRPWLLAGAVADAADAAAVLSDGGQLPRRQRSALIAIAAASAATGALIASSDGGAR